MPAPPRPRARRSLFNDLLSRAETAKPPAPPPDASVRTSLQRSLVQDGLQLALHFELGTHTTPRARKAARARARQATHVPVLPPPEPTRAPSSDDAILIAPKRRPQKPRPAPLSSSFSDDDDDGVLLIHSDDDFVEIVPKLPAPEPSLHIPRSPPAEELAAESPKAARVSKTVASPPQRTTVPPPASKPLPDTSDDDDVQLVQVTAGTPTFKARIASARALQGDPATPFSKKAPMPARKPAPSDFGDEVGFTRPVMHRRSKRREEVGRGAVTRSGAKKQARVPARVPRGSPIRDRRAPLRVSSEKGRGTSPVGTQARGREGDVTKRKSIPTAKAVRMAKDSSAQKGGQCRPKPNLGVNNLNDDTGLSTGEERLPSSSRQESCAREDRARREALGAGALEKSKGMETRFPSVAKGGVDPPFLRTRLRALQALQKERPVEPRKTTALQKSVPLTPRKRTLTVAEKQSLVAPPRVETRRSATALRRPRGLANRDPASDYTASQRNSTSKSERQRSLENESRNKLVKNSPSSKRKPLVEVIDLDQGSEETEPSGDSLGSDDGSLLGRDHAQHEVWKQGRMAESHIRQEHPCPSPGDRGHGALRHVDSPPSAGGGETGALMSNGAEASHDHPTSQSADKLPLRSRQSDTTRHSSGEDKAHSARIKRKYGVNSTKTDEPQRKVFRTEPRIMITRRFSDPMDLPELDSLPIPRSGFCRDQTTDNSLMVWEKENQSKLSRVPIPVSVRVRSAQDKQATMSGTVNVGSQVAQISSADLGQNAPFTSNTKAMHSPIKDAIKQQKQFIPSSTELQRQGAWSRPFLRSPTRTKHASEALKAQEKSSLPSHQPIMNEDIPFTSSNAKRPRRTNRREVENGSLQTPDTNPDKLSEERQRNESARPCEDSRNSFSTKGISKRRRSSVDDLEGLGRPPKVALTRSVPGTAARIPFVQSPELRSSANFVSEKVGCGDKKIRVRRISEVGAPVSNSISLDADEKTLFAPCKSSISAPQSISFGQWQGHEVASSAVQPGYSFLVGSSENDEPSDIDINFNGRSTVTNVPQNWTEANATLDRAKNETRTPALEPPRQGDSVLSTDRSDVRITRRARMRRSPRKSLGGPDRCVSKSTELPSRPHQALDFIGSSSVRPNFQETAGEVVQDALDSTKHSPADSKSRDLQSKQACPTSKNVHQRDPVRSPESGSEKDLPQVQKFCVPAESLPRQHDDRQKKTAMPKGTDGRIRSSEEQPMGNNIPPQRTFEPQRWLRLGREGSIWKVRETCNFAKPTPAEHVVSDQRVLAKAVEDKGPALLQESVNSGLSSGQVPSIFARIRLRPPVATLNALSATHSELAQGAHSASEVPQAQRAGNSSSPAE